MKLLEILELLWFKNYMLKNLLKNLNLFSFIVKNKLNNLDIKTVKKRKIKKNILFIIHSLQRGGAERQLVKLSNLLHKKNFDVKILFTNFN